ncbi:MAG TPA: MFS transporter [Trebonia sp.]|jgi:predicted MFS family arabinose efflux permease|nr:MFS transporter [Trebonia sp.]
MAHPLRDRNFRLLFTGRVVDQLGDAVSPAALTLAIVIATRSTAGLAVVLVCALLPKVTLLPVGGVVADRLGPRPVAMAAAVVSGVAQLAIGLLLLAGHVDFLLIAIAAAVKGAASAFDTPATLPLVAGTTEGDGRQAANALMGIAGSATNLAGPALAGVLLFTVGAGWAFVLDAATFGFSAGTLALIKVRRVHVPRKSLRADLAAGWTEVRSRTWYWTSLIGHATWNFAAGLLATTGPLIAVTELGGKSVWLAALEASAVGYLAGAFIAGRTKVSRAILVGNIALMSYAVPLVLFAIAAPAWLVVVAYGLAMACLGFLNPVWETAVQQEVPAEVLARVSAYDWLVSLGAMPLGYALGPVLTREFGYTWPLAGAAALVLITLSLPVSLPDVRNLRLHHAPAYESRVDVAA